MFSGIVEELGVVRKLPVSPGAIFEVGACRVLEGAQIGDSIAVNGACLTVVKKTPASLGFQVLPETAKVTSLKNLKIGDKVNLERALKLGYRISGHFVTGHVDTTGVIRRKGYVGGNLCFEIAVPAAFMRYILPKGSVAVDGISLTVAAQKSAVFSVYIIPHTLENTTLGFKGSSSFVNVEFDILAKRAASGS